MFYNHCIAGLNMTKIGTKSTFHFPSTSHPMLGKVSHFDGNIENNTSITSQATFPQAATVPQAPKNQTPNTLNNVFAFLMPQ